MDVWLPKGVQCSWLGTKPLQWVIQKYQWAYHPWKYLNEVMHHPEWVQNLEKMHEWFDGRRQPIHQCSETQVYTWRDYRVSMSFNFHHLGMPTASQTEVTAQKLLRVCPCDWELEAIIGQKATAPNYWCKRMIFFGHASHFAHGRSIVQNPIVTTRVRLSYLTRLLDNSVEMIRMAVTTEHSQGRPR